MTQVLIRYVGERKDGKWHGQGTFTWAGNKYAQATPYTCIIGDDHIRYVGEWENGEEHGQGTKTWADGSTYA